MADKLFGIHAQALQLRARKAELLASNLANADTPNYKARDVDFREVLGSEMGSGTLPMIRSHAGHMTSSDLSGFDNVTMKYRVPSQPSLDGNTVDAQTEKGEFAANSVRYMASMQFLEGRIRGLIKTLREE
jgi:flagellar basal-body rod protein FlgB